MKLTQENFAYSEVLADLKEELTGYSKNLYESLESVTFSKFLELIAFFKYKTESDIYSYINEAQLQRMQNLFPYFFTVLPNRFLLEVKPKIELVKPLKINIGEKLIGYNKHGVCEEVYCTNILDAHIMPCNISECDYDYNEKNVRIKIKGNAPFIYDIENFNVWVNYNNDIERSIFILNFLKLNESCIGIVKFADGDESEYKINFSYDSQFHIHPNFNVKLMLNSPEFFLKFIVDINNLNKSCKPIEEISLEIKAQPLIAKYNLKNIFHLNYLPVINQHTEYSQVIEYDSTKETYPMLHPVSDSFFPCFIRNVTVELENKTKKITPEIFLSCNKNNSYRIISRTNLLNKRYQHISLNLPVNIIKTEVNVLAEWTQLFELEPIDIDFCFYNKQIGLFEFNTLYYQKFSDLNHIENSGNILGLLKLHNSSYLRKSDFNILINTLIDDDSIFSKYKYDLLGLRISKQENRLCTYELIFIKSGIIDHILIKLMVKALEIFLNSNLGFEKRIVCTAEFKALKTQS